VVHQCKEHHLDSNAHILQCLRHLDVCEMCELLRVCFNDTGARQDGQRKSLHAASWMS
jgi:hypothetical protein